MVWLEVLILTAPVIFTWPPKLVVFPEATSSPFSKVALSVDFKVPLIITFCSPVSGLFFTVNTLVLLPTSKSFSIVVLPLTVKALSEVSVISTGFTKVVLLESTVTLL